MIPTGLSAFNSISLAGGDDGDLGHHCAELIAFGLGMLSMSEGLPHIPIIRRDGVRTKHFGQSLRRCENSFNLDRDQLPNPSLRRQLCLLAEFHLGCNTVELCLKDVGEKDLTVGPSSFLGVRGLDSSHVLSIVSQ